MRLYGAIQKVEPQDDGTVRVHGIAASEAVDDQGEIVRAEAMRAAIPDYMCFPALREMHQLSAAGTTLEAEVWEDGTTRIVAHVIDPVAVAKVKNRVYRGFSIGGRVTKRDPSNPKAITGLMLNEISLVDRPANPEAIFDCWKAGSAKESSTAAIDFARAKGGLPPQAGSRAVGERFNPIQVWACGIPDHRHLAKADALRCLSAQSAEPTAAVATLAGTESMSARSRTVNESALAASAGAREIPAAIGFADPGFQPDNKKRLPIDTERHIRATWTYINKPGNTKKYTDHHLRQIKTAIISAWKEKIDKAGPSTAEDGRVGSRARLTKAVWDIGRAARVTIDLDWVKDVLDLEATVENDDTTRPVTLQAIITELCDFLNRLIAERAGEIHDDAEFDDFPLASQMPGMLAMAAGFSGIGRVAAVLQDAGRNTRGIADLLLAKTKRSRGDQALLDMAHFACDRRLILDGLSISEREHILGARDQLHRAGAISVDMIEDDPVTAARHEMLRMAATLFGKRERPYEHMMDIAHECIRTLGDGRVCGGAETAGARYSLVTVDPLEAVHDHLVAAGAKCDSANSGNIGLEVGERVDPQDLVQALAGERAEKAELGKLLGEIMPTLERLTKRVDDMARTPLPPLTIAKGTVSISKQQDHGSIAGGDPELPTEAVAAAFAKMSKENQTLALIKASYANPIRLAGAASSNDKAT